MPDQMSRQELLEARAKIQNQIAELKYGPVAGGGGGTASPKPALFERLNEILEEIDQELAEMDDPHA